MVHFWLLMQKDQKDEFDAIFLMTNLGSFTKSDVLLTQL